MVASIASVHGLTGWDDLRVQHIAANKARASFVGRGSNFGSVSFNYNEHRSCWGPMVHSQSVHPIPRKRQTQSHWPPNKSPLGEVQKGERKPLQSTGNPSVWLSGFKPSVWLSGFTRRKLPPQQSSLRKVPNLEMARNPVLDPLKQPTSMRFSPQKHNKYHVFPLAMHHRGWFASAKRDTNSPHELQPFSPNQPTSVCK